MTQLPDGQRRLDERVERNAKCESERDMTQSEAQTTRRCADKVLPNKRMLRSPYTTSMKRQALQCDHPPMRDDGSMREDGRNKRLLAQNAGLGDAAQYAVP